MFWGDYSSTASRSPFPHKGRLTMLVFRYLKTYKYQYVFGYKETEDIPRKPSLVRDGGTRQRRVTDE